MDNALQFAMVKAAALGFAQSLYNNGANDQEVAALTRQYTDENDGLMAKRAARQELIMGLVANRLAEIGALK